MKKNLYKVLIFLVLTIMLFSICACNYVPATRFMSRSQVNSLVKEYGTPQAELTIKYQLSDSKDYVIKITYDLLLSQAPLAVVRFIQLANEGAYDNSIIDTYNSTYNYMILGRYLYQDSIVSENKKNYYVNYNLDTTFKGEFASNKYGKPSDGYAQFAIFSLAMYHDDYVNETDTNFDSANGGLILATANNTLNSNNYAVFAKMVSMSYQIDSDDPVTMPNGGVHSQALANLVSATSKTSSRTVYTDESEEKTVPSFSMMSQIFNIEVKILGDKDWSKLPQIGK